MEATQKHYFLFPGHLYKTKAMCRHLDVMCERLNCNGTMIESPNKKPTRDIEHIVDVFNMQSENKLVYVESHSFGAVTSTLATAGHDNIIAASMVAPAWKIELNFLLDVHNFLTTDLSKHTTSEKKLLLQAILNYLKNKVKFAVRSSSPQDLLSFWKVPKTALNLLKSYKPTYPISIIRAANDETVSRKGVDIYKKAIATPIDFYELEGGGHSIYTHTHYEQVLLNLLEQIFTRQPVHETDKVRHFILQ